jgi:hypothetical protein
MVDVTNTHVPGAFFWSAVDALPSDWEVTVERALNHPDIPGLAVKVCNNDEIAVYDAAWSEHVPGAYFHFPRGRGAGEVLRVAGDLSVLAALRIAQLLGLDLSDKDGNVMPKDRPLEWLSRVDFGGSASVVEALAVRLGLVPKRYALTQLAPPQPANDSPIFF